jgi:hypothetical protein
MRTVPDSALSEELLDLIEWLGELVRQVDSSLLDEWEALLHPGEQPDRAAIDAKPRPLTQNRRAFSVLVRNSLFHRVELIAARRWNELGELDGEDGWTMERWFEAMAPYFAEYDHLGIDNDARNPALLLVDEQPEMWTVHQLLADPNGDHDWRISGQVDLAASDEAGSAVVRIVAVGPTDS